MICISECAFFLLVRRVAISLRQFVVLCAVLVSLGQTSAANANNIVAHRVLLTKLLATPNKYDGMLIRVTGYLLYQADLHKTKILLCAKNGATARLPKGISLVSANSNSAAFSQFSTRNLQRSCVIVEGDFKQSRVTHVSCIRVHKIESARSSSEPRATSGKLGEGYSTWKCRDAEYSPVGDFWVRNHTGH